MQDTTEQLQHPPADDGDRLHFFWAFLYLASAACELGLGPALRGSWIGMDASIDGLTRFSGALSQTTGILSCILIVRTTLAGMNTGVNLLGSLVRGLLATLPIITLMIAHRDPLPGAVILGACAASTLIWFSVAFDWSRARLRGSPWIWLWCAAFAGKALGAAGLAAGTSEVWGGAISGLGAGLAWATTGVVFLAAARATRHAPLAAALLLGVAVLLGQTVGAAAHPDSSTGVLLVGRSLSALAQGSPAEPFALALLLASACLFVALRSARGVPLAALGFSLLLPLSPLSCAAFTLGALQIALWGHQLGARSPNSLVTRR